MQQSTLKKLSEVLGISISTVSRALKDHPDISTTTKQKVKELAKAMEYEPNAYAVQLRTRQSNVLGIIVPDIQSFFYDSFIAAIEEAARSHGFSVLIMQSGNNAETEAANLQLMRKHMTQGVFIALTYATTDYSLFHKMESMDLPIVFADCVPADDGFTKVAMADEEAARLAAEELIHHKKKNILALFGHPQLSVTQKRVQAFEETFKQKAPRSKLTIRYPYFIENSKEAFLDVISTNKKLDAVFCMGDMNLAGVMKAIQELNLTIPDDIGVIAISNGFIPTMFKPKITYVETSGYKLGKLAFEQMQKRLINEQVSENVCVPSVLIEGGSL
jgi:LacI family transcriptional regulator